MKVTARLLKQPPAGRIKKTRQRSTLLLLLVLMSSFQAATAQFPVQINTQLRPPYTLQLSDYYASTQEKLVAIVTNRDLNKPLLQVRLRMTIESQSAALRSSASASLPVLDLQAGERLRLTQSDLAPYFLTQNLDFGGITRQQYQQQARLPEGLYQFCFEAIEVSTGQIVSAKSCAMAWISLSDPPWLNLPARGEAIAYREPQNIVFQWTPRHLNSPNGAFLTEYDFQLVELWDDALAPEVAFQTAIPLYETSTRTTTLLYGPSQPLLIVGKRYGWRVRARAQVGAEATDVFRNQGFSEIHWFTYQDACPPPIALSAEPGSFGNLEFTWGPNISHKSFLLTYRQQGNDKLDWFSQKTEQNTALVYDVQPGLTYQYRVAAFCNTAQPTFSELKTVTIPARTDESFVNCTLVPDANITNREPVAALKVGDIIRAGDFPVKIQELSGSGTYTGKGYVTVPFLGKAKVRVTLNDIQVNTQYQLFAGNVATKYNEKGNGIVDIDAGLDIFRGYEGLVSRIRGLSIRSDLASIEKVAEKTSKQAEEKLPPEQAQHVKEVLTKIVDAKTAYDKAEAEYEAATTPEEKAAAEEKKTQAEKAFVDAQNSFEGKPSGAVDSLSYTVAFSNADDALYGFDKLRHTPDHDANYDVRQRGGQVHYVPWKAVEASRFDWVKVEAAEDGKTLPDNLVFRSTTGTLQTVQGKNPDEVLVKVFAFGSGEKNEVLAYSRREAADGKEIMIETGSLNVVGYRKINRKLVLVPVNETTLGVSASDVQRGLNGIYGKAVVQWSVQVDRPLQSNYDPTGEGLGEDREYLLTNYSAGMTAIINDYKARGSFDSDTYYIFLVPRSKGGTRLGFMPSKRNAGFVFTDMVSGEALVKTIAHELGHGAFRLEHTNATYPALAAGTTDNLMDVQSTGAELHKYQWDLIHDPAFVIPELQPNDDHELAPLAIKCLTGASLDFAINYSIEWIGAQFNDDIPEYEKPAFTDFSTITGYDGFSWKENIISAGIACGAANLPPVLSGQSGRKIAVGLSALGSGATGFATETGKQYDVAFKKLEKQGKATGVTDVILAIDWQPVIVNSASSAIISGAITWITTSKKYDVLVKKICDKLRISDLAREKQKVIDYLQRKISNAVELAPMNSFSRAFTREAEVKNWLNKINDGKAYIAVHGVGDKFRVLHNGAEIEFNHRSLARWIQDKPELKGKDIVLLTCANDKAAQNLANALDRRVVAWDGTTEIHSTGFIRGIGNCYEYVKSKTSGFARMQLSGGNIPRGKPNAPPTENDKVVLGEVGGTGNLISTATKAITKSRLPDEFVKALKTFGKSENDILDYFTKYHNDNGFRFLNEAEDLAAQFPTLTKGEAYSLWGYTTNYFYDDLNLWLRQGTNLTKANDVKTMLNSALGKLNNFSSPIIYRGIRGNTTSLLSSYAPGSKHTWNAFTSCGSSQAASFANKADVILEIKHLDAKDISDFADGIKFRGYPPSELLIKAGSEFKVISNNKIDALSGKPIIELLQVK